jgi:hypothetical protein
MSWSRAVATTALVEVLQVAMGETAAVFAKPPQTINPPAVVVSRPSDVTYATASFSIDAATLPVMCFGPADGEDVVDALLGQLRQAVDANASLNGAVQVCYAQGERGWRNLNVAGIDLLVAETVLVIQM